MEIQQTLANNKTSNTTGQQDSINSQADSNSEQNPSQINPDSLSKNKKAEDLARLLKKKDRSYENRPKTNYTIANPFRDE
ncbi:hypothetical protein JW887_01985 [Candidatus Dojkabacteria bacterium]|nr:hypothetical protein [Candidatus Dojkabacteria bacterium]